MNAYKKYDVIVVGGGAGGLAASCYLARYGYSVLLCEKNSKVGGLVNGFKMEGFYFDGGIRAFENSGIIKPMLKQLEIEIDFLKNPVSLGIGNDVIYINSRDNIEDYQGMLFKHFPNDTNAIVKIIAEIKKVIEYMDVLYGIDNPLFLDNITEDKEYLFKTILPWLFKYQKNIKKIAKLNEPINDYLKKYTTNNSLIDMITQHFFQNTPTFFALSYFGQYSDYIYPVGGTKTLVDKLSEYYISHSGEILLDKSITSIDRLNKTVKTEDGETFGYEKLVWACDTKKMLNSLSESDFLNNKKTLEWKNLVNQNKGSDSILSLFMGLDVDSSYFEKICSPHFFYTPNSKGINYDNKELQSDEEKLVGFLNNTTYEISFPVLRDKKLAPNNKTGIIVSTLMDYELTLKFENLNKYDEFKSIATKTIIKVLDESIFRGISKNILFTSCSTPITIKNIIGSSDGAITGWAFSDKDKPNETRFKKIAKAVLTPFSDIYQAGQWAFSPSGLPTCLLTGKLAADRIIKDLKKKR